MKTLYDHWNEISRVAVDIIDTLEAALEDPDDCPEGEEYESMERSLSFWRDVRDILDTKGKVKIYSPKNTR